MPTRTAGEQRIVALEGCCNFRDVGGYPAGQGRQVRWRRLYRADALHRLTGADLETLTALGPLTVLDLRTAQEVGERGRVSEVMTVAYHHLPLVDVLPDREDLAVWLDADTIAARYREMLETGADAACEALAILTDPSAYPAVVHCAAGKDRTGILIALILGLLGVPDSHIAADYALSGPAMKDMLVRLREQYPDAGQSLERYSPALMAAEPATCSGYWTGCAPTMGRWLATPSTSAWAAPSAISARPCSEPSTERRVTQAGRSNWGYPLRSGRSIQKWWGDRRWGRRYRRLVGEGGAYVTMFRLDTRCRVPGCTFVAVAYLAPGPDGEPEIFIGTPSRLEHFPVCQHHLDVDKRRSEG